MPSILSRLALSWMFRFLGLGVVLVGAVLPLRAGEEKPVAVSEPVTDGQQDQRIMQTLQIEEFASRPLVAEPKKWDGAEKSLWTTFLVASALDAYQTMTVAGTDGPGGEINPLYGEEPELARILALKGLATLIAYRYVDKSDHRRRKLFLKILTGLQLGVVVANERRVEGGIVFSW